MSGHLPPKRAPSNPGCNCRIPMADTATESFMAGLFDTLRPKGPLAQGVVAASSAATQRYDTATQGTPFTHTVELKPPPGGLLFTHRANSQGNYGRFGKSYTEEELNSHRECLAALKEKAAAEKAARKEAREVERAAVRERRAEEKVAREKAMAARKAAREAKVGAPSLTHIAL